MNAVAKKPKSKFNLVRLTPILVLVIGFILFFYFDGASYIGLDTLKEQRANLNSLVERLGILAPVLYGAFYAVVVAFSLPLGSLMTITAGFLFGIVTGTISVVLGATIGATLLFLALQMGFGKSLAKNSAGWMSKMQAGFNHNAFSYLLVLRLIPVFPFALVNIAAALLGVSLSAYFFATLIGIVPGTVVYILLGNGLGAIFDSGGTPHLGIIFEPQIIAPILGMAALVLLQVVYRHLRNKAQNKKKSAGKAGAKSGKSIPNKSGRLKKSTTSPATTAATSAPKKRGRPRKSASSS